MNGEKSKGINEETTMKREVKIGFFLGIACLILVVLIFLTGDVGSFFKKPGYYIHVCFDSVAGLEKGTLVRMAGVKIGKVKDIRLKGNTAEVIMGIDEGVRICKDAKATLASLGLLGEKYIEILPGEMPVYCQPEDTIEGLPPVSLDQLGTQAMSIAEEFKKIGGMLRDIIGEEESRENIKDTVKNLSVFVAELRNFLAENREDLDKSIKNSSEIIDRFEKEIVNASRNLDELIANLNGILDENRADVRLNVQNTKDLIAKIDESLELVNQSLEKINKGEGTVGKLIQEPDLYEEAEKTMDELKRVIGPFSSLQLHSGLQFHYYGKSDLVKSYISLSLWPTPKNWFLAQIIHDPSLEKFTYSIQGGLRFGAFTPRAGIFESQIGGGIDCYALDDRLTVSFEAFDFNRQPRPHLRLWTKYAPSRYFYFLAGVDDFTLAARREGFFGIGVGF